MQRWEYHTLNLNEVPRKRDGIDLLADAGEEGWELVHITTNNIAYLKRPIDEPAIAKSIRRKPATPTVQNK